MQLLVIKVGQLEDNPQYALLGKKQAHDRFTAGDWKHVSTLTRGRKVLLLIPNEDVVLTSISIPSKNKRQLLQAIPFALEDTLADDIDNLHFAVASDADSGKSDVGIINKSLLAEYISTLQSKGITVHFILPELLAQKIDIDAWSIALTNNAYNPISVRLGDASGFSCGKELLGLFLTEQLEKSEPKLVFTNLPKEQIPEELEDTPVNSLDPNIIESSSVLKALSLNLISNFVPHKKTPVINWKAWKPVAIIASLLVATWLGILFGQNIDLQNRSDQLNKQIETTFKSVFPNKRIVDGAVAQQMGIELKQLLKNKDTTIESPLPLVADISPLLKEFKDINLNEIRYQENELSLIMQAPNLTRLENFKKDAAEKVNLKVEIKTSTTTANKVEATLIISPMSETLSKQKPSQIREES